MSIRKVSFAFGEFYHIYNRGNSKQVIFHDNEDYCHFIKLLYVANNKDNFTLRNLDKIEDYYSQIYENKLVNIGAYCLMPNHFHLLVTQTEEGSVSKFMQKLTTAYAMFYNKKYERTGSLFEGKFKSKHIDNDIYFKYLFSYLHLNPVKLIQKDWKDIGIKNKTEAIFFLDNYKHSSYLDYAGLKRKENIILDTKVFPDYFPSKEKFKKEIFEWLSYRE